MNEPRVFGIGLCKTGTKSLARALELLGIPTIHYPCDAETFRALKRGECPTGIMNRYRAAADLPIAGCYPQLDAVFPGSKFILTVRDPSAWLTSTKCHWHRHRKYFDNDHPVHGDDRHAFALFIAACVFGCYRFHPQRFEFVFQRHRANVADYFRDRPQDLLVLDVCGGDGWEKLCSFLSLPVPKMPFPWLGRSGAS